MSGVVDLALLKERWNDVLDALEKIDRVAWLAYFDARLVSLENGILLLDFSDPNKFSGGHDYSKRRNERFKPSLESVMKDVLGQRIEVREIS